MRRTAWLAGIAVVFAAAACGGGDGDDLPPPESIQGVWSGTLTRDAAAEDSELCLDVTQAAQDDGADAISFGGDLYLEGELAGLIGGVLAEGDLVTFGGSSQIGAYSGKLEGVDMAGTWVQTSANVVPLLGSWSAEKTDRESCD